MARFPTCLLLAIVLFALSSRVSSIKVNSDGGYEVLLAIDESTPVPSVGVARYIENVKNSLGTFSSRLWMATENRFYFKSVDIFLPTSWTVNVTSSMKATTQSYQSADIRISPSTAYPHAENMFACGQPGNAIDLPESFFTAATSGPFGVHAKSLLHLWALYRFGVHPEHGMIGDSRYPYSYWDRQLEQLSVTGCSDEPIKGRFVDITNPDASCNTEGSASNINCRFVPDSQGQNATTSLMFLQWIDTVDHFCDSHNHNKLAINQQNSHCDHKSVWEVIRETPDYLAVSAPRQVVPAITFNLVKESATPLFYLLLDRGMIQGSYSITTMVPPLLAQFVAHNNLRNTIASVGGYPGNNGPVEEIVPWTEIGPNLDAFHDSIGELRTNGSLERDFSRALVAVADEIKRKNHPNGAVVLVVKFGADVDNFGTYLPESEVTNAFNEGNIVLHSIELSFPEQTTTVSHLANICQGTGGGFTVLDNFGEVEFNTNNVLNFVRRMLETHYSDLDRDWKTLKKDTMTAATSIPLAAGINGPFQIFVSSPNGDLTSANFSVTGFNSSIGGTPRDLTFGFRKSQDYNDAGSKHTYRLQILQTELDEVSLVTLRVTCTANNCANSVLARTQFTGEVNEVQISVQTSVENNEADLSSGRPVSVFAKVTKSGVPVEGAQVIASMKERATSRATLIQLTDDGDFAPDVQKLDGIYSAYFAPEQDGQYDLSVTVQGNPTFVSQPPTSLEGGHFIQLLPTDPADSGCGSGDCDNAEQLEASFSQTVDASAPFTVLNASEYVPNPTKILTLTKRDNPARNQVTFYWDAPSVPGRQQQAVSSYEFRSATLFELLVTDFDNQELISTNPDPLPPSGMESVTISNPSSTTYYAVRSVYRDKKSVPSNIVEVVIQEPEPPSTTTMTPPTTTEDPPSTTTDDVPPPTTTGSTDPTPNITTTEGGGTSTADPTDPSESYSTTDMPATTASASKTGYKFIPISIAAIILFLTSFL